MPSQPLTVSWKSFVDGRADAPTLPATFGTPAGAWTYGAGTDLIETSTDAVVMIEAEALRGKVGVSLISEDYSKLASEEKLITPADGRTTVRLTFAPAKSPARMLVRNYADGGNAGEVRIHAAMIEVKP